MYDLYLASGIPVLLAGILSFIYLTYIFFQRRVSRNTKRSVLILLSETLVSIGIAVLFIWFYSKNSVTTQNNTNITSALKLSFNNTYNTSSIDPNDCSFQDLLMQQAILVISLAHCFSTLMTSGFQCQKCIKIETDPVQITVKPSTSEKSIDTKDAETTNEKDPYISFSKNDLVTILLQWVIPLSTVLFMCISMDMFEIKVEETKPDEIQMLISDVLENPMNVSSNDQYKQDVDNIVSRVYSIIEQISSNETNEQTGPKPEDIYNIIEMLEVKTREPKMLTEKMIPNENNYKFKIYSFFFTIFDVLVPLLYSNITYFQSKMCLRLNQCKNSMNKTVGDLSTNLTYLKLSIIFATLLCTPSFLEFLSRTFLTNYKPNLTSQGLLATSSAYLLIRNGINLKAIKQSVNQNNNVAPSN